MDKDFLILAVIVGALLYPRFSTDQKLGKNQFASGLCTALADRIEADGERKEPKLKYVANVFDLRNLATDVGLDGKKLKDIDPDFVKKASDIFSQYKDGTEELTKDKRKELVNAFRQLGD